MNDSMQPHLGISSNNEDSPYSGDDPSGPLRHTAVAAVPVNDDQYDPESIRGGVLLDTPSKTEGPRAPETQPFHYDPQLLQNLRKALTQNCFDSDLDLSTPLSSVPFIADVSNDAPDDLVTQLAQELIEMKEEATLSDFVDEIATQVCEVYQKYQLTQSSQFEHFQSLRMLDKIKRSLLACSETSYGNGSKTSLFVCAAEKFAPANYEILVKIKDSVSLTELTFHQPSILAGFEMQMGEDVLEEICQPKQRFFKTPATSNPAFTFTVERVLPADMEEEEDEQNKERKEGERIGECTVQLKDVVLFSGMEHLKRRNIPPTALKFPIVKTDEEQLEPRPSVLSTHPDSVMGYIHVRFALYLSKCERLHYVDVLQHETRSLLQQVQGELESDQHRMDSFLAPFQGVLFDGKEGRIYSERIGGARTPVRGSQQPRRPHIPPLDIEMIHHEQEYQRYPPAQSKKMMYLNKSVDDEELRSSRMRPKDGRNCGCQRDCNLSFCGIF